MSQDENTKIDEGKRLGTDLLASANHGSGTPSSADQGKEEFQRSTIANLLDNMQFSSRTENGLQTLIGEILQETNLFNANRRTYFSVLQKYENDPFVIAICNAVAEFLFDDDEESAIDISVTCEKNPKYAEEVERMFEEIEIADLLDRNIEQMLVYGEFPVKVESVKGRGVVGVKEVYAPGEVVTVFEGNDPIAYFRYRDSTIRNTVQGHAAHQIGQATESVEIPFHEVLVFRMPGRRLKLAAGDEGLRAHYRSKREEGEYFVQASRSLIWPAINKFQQLAVAEAATTALKLKTLARPTLVSLQLPASVSGKQSLKYTQRFEKLLNSSGADISSAVGSHDLSGLISTCSASNIKVIPQFDNGKGDLNRTELDRDLRNDALGSDGEESNKGLKSEILSLLGIPPDLYFADGARVELRAYSRFYRKLKKISRAITKELSVLALNHCVQRYGDLELTTEDFVISTGSNASLESLDAAEAVSLIGDNVRDLMAMQQSLQDAGVLDKDEGLFDKEALLEFIKSELGKSGASKISSIFIDKPGEEIVTPTDSETADRLSDI